MLRTEALTKFSSVTGNRVGSFGPAPSRECRHPLRLFKRCNGRRAVCHRPEPRARLEHELRPLRSRDCHLRCAHDAVLGAAGERPGHDVGRCIGRLRWRRLRGRNIEDELRTLCRPARRYSGSDRRWRHRPLTKAAAAIGTAPIMPPTLRPCLTFRKSPGTIRQPMARLLPVEAARASFFPKPPGNWVPACRMTVRGMFPISPSPDPPIMTAT